MTAAKREVKALRRNCRGVRRRNPHAALWEATELLRDLAAAVEWMLDTKPDAATFELEHRRVQMHLEDAREFVRSQDSKEAAEDLAAEQRLSL
jgi:hypothetical protein